MAPTPRSHPTLARLGSSELFLLELQGELEVSGTKHGKPVGRLTIDDTNTMARYVGGVVLSHVLQPLPHVHSTLQPQSSFLTSVCHVTSKGKPTLRIGHHLFRRQDRQFTQDTGHIATLHVRSATTSKVTRNARREWRR